MRRRYVRIALLVVLCVALGLLLARCPTNRDGTPGRLAQAMEETTAAARSGALALDLRRRDRSTLALAAVQISDARDEAVSAFQGIAELRAEDPVDVGRQRMLTESITAIIAELSTASASVRGLADQPPLDAVHDRLLMLARALETRYR